MQHIKVLLVDQLPVVREGLQNMLQAEDDIQIVGEASDGLEALETVAKHHPQIVLTGLDLPNLDGLETVRQICREFPETLVIVFNTPDRKSLVVEARLAGARGYLPLDVSKELLTHSIRTVSNGGVVTTIGIENMISSLLRANSIPPENQPDEPEVTGMATVAPLTPRECDVLALLADGLTNRQIAKDLSISEETAKKHVQRIIAKLGATDRTQAAVRALRKGIIC